MPPISQPTGVGQHRTTDAPGGTQKVINTVIATWHAAFPGGSAVNATSGFTDPDPLEADRVPELALAALGTPGTYAITGTWGEDPDGNPLEQTEEITTVADATVRGTKPFDTITSIVGPAPGQTLTLNKGDSYFSPPTRAIWTGSASGAIGVQLHNEPPEALKAVALPAFRDWPRSAVRVRADDGSAEATTLDGAMAVW